MPFLPLLLGEVGAHLFGVRSRSAQIPKGLVLAASFHVEASRRRPRVRGASPPFALPQAARGRPGPEGPGTGSRAAALSLHGLKMCVKTAPRMPPLVENKKPDPRCILVVIIIVIVTIFYFLEVPLSGDLMAEVFPRASLGEPGSAVCAAKGVRGARGEEKRSRRARGQRPGPTSPSTAPAPWAVAYPLGLTLHI